ncbi:MAG: lysophospholipid acyltransferase family protein [Gammaproteobacteria bacterium]
MKIILIKLVLYISAWLPLPVIHGLGWGVGWGLILFPNRSQRDTAINIDLCLPEYSTGARRRLVRKNLLETGKTFIETGALWLRPGEKTLQLIRAVDGDQLVKDALAQGRGVILATPHLGAWEAAGLYCAAHFDITCLYRPLKMPELEILVRSARNRLGGTYVPTDPRGIRTLYKTLEQARAIAMLPDQEPRSGTGIFAPFFGKPAYTMVLLSRLAARTGAPVIFTWCERLTWGRGYHLHFRSVPETLYAADMVTSATAVNAVVERCVRENPAQYQWSYRRFRTRPKGEESVYVRR